MTLAELNAMSAPEFVASLGGLFEHSPWVAEGVVAESGALRGRKRVPAMLDRAW